MMKTCRQSILALAAVTAACVAAEPTLVPDSPYRLQLPKGELYRLAGEFRPAERAAAAPVVDTAKAAALAARPFAEQIDRAAKEARLDPALVHAVVAVESGYRHDAVSPQGAIGLMQVLPGTARRYGIRAPQKSVQDNLRAGTRYLSDLMLMFDNRLDLVLAAYNAGEGAVVKYKNRVPPYRETQAYVPAVLERYESWRVIEKPRSGSIGPVVYLAGTQLDTQGLEPYRRRPLP